MDGFVLVFVLPILALAIYVYYRFLRTLRDLLRAVSEQNRGMSPGLVWLNWIPLFGLAWIFVTIVKIRESARAEFVFRGVREDGGIGFGVGITFAVTNVLSEIGVPPSSLENEDALWVIAVFTGLMGLVSLICWILYWMKMANLRDMLVNTIGARPFSPEDVRYQPQPWQTPPQMSPPPQTSQSPPQAPPAAQYQGEQDPRLQSGPWLGRQPAASPVSATAPGAPAAPTTPMAGATPAADGAPEAGAASSTAKCPYCGTPYRADAGFCSSCGRPASR